MSPSATSRDPEEKKRRVLDAALDLFADRGFHGTAVPLIAEKAGVGAGTIYRYFESKEVLVNALYKREKQALVLAGGASMSLDASPREQFSAFLRSIFSYAETNPRAIQFLEHHHHQSYLDAESLGLEEQAFGMARAFLAETRKAKITKDCDPDVIINVVWGSIVMLLKLSLGGQLKLTQQVQEQTEQVLWEAVRL